MYIIYHVKVTFFTLIILLFKLSFTVNFHVINWFGGNFKHFRKTKANLRNATLASCSGKHTGKRYSPLLWTTRCQPKLQNREETMFYNVWSRGPDGVLYNHAARTRQQRLDCCVSTTPTACSTALWMMERNCTGGH